MSTHRHPTRATTTDTSTRHADAARLAGWLDLAARGWHLFPVRPHGKAPAIIGWQDRATTDPDRILRFFTTHPDHNAGIACGPSGLLVIDCDTPKPDQPAGARDGWSVLAELATAHGGLTDTWTVATPSGGRHLYYRPPDGAPRLGNTSRLLGRMLDTRGRGGQVLAPSSRLPRGGYALIDDTDPAELPAWLLAALTNPPAPAGGPATAFSGPPVRAGAGLGDRHAYLSAVVRAELQRVAGAGRGGHNTAVFTAARALGQLAAAGLLDPAAVEHDLTHAARHIVAGPCDCTARDITTSIRSGLAAGARRPRHLPPVRTDSERRSA